MRSTRLGRVVAVAIAVGAMVVASSCGSQRPGAAAKPVTPADAVDSEAQAIRREVHAFYDSWTGGRSGQTAAEVLIVHDNNGPLSACLQRAGYDVTWERGISGTTFMDGLNATRWLRDPLRRRYTWIAVMDAYSARVEERQLHDRQVPDRVVDECVASSPPVGEEGVLKTSLPLKQQRLMADWDARIAAAVEPVAGDRVAYDSCVLAGDLPDQLAGAKDMDQLADGIEAAMPPADEVPIGNDQPSSVWQDWLDVEAQLLQAEWSCSEPVYAEAIRRLPAVVDAFSRDHGQEIQELVDHWQRVKRDAAALGWSEDRPFLSSTPKGWVNPEVAYPAALEVAG